jgi:DNA-binding FadR family transcriptional regulator
MTNKRASSKAAVPARPERLHAGIARRIGESILGGEYVPGSLLPNEAHWVRSFGASRTVVREAIRSLSAKGLISSRPKIGSRVEPRHNWNLLDRDVLAWHRSAVDRRSFLHSTQELRRLVEPGIAELAARKRSAVQLEQLARAFEAMKTAESHDEMVAADVLFHKTLLACCNNDLLVPFGILIEETLANLFDFTTSRNPHYRQALRLHGAIVKAVVAANAAAARKAMLALIDDTDQVIAVTGRRK